MAVGPPGGQSLAWDPDGPATHGFTGALLGGRHRQHHGDCRRPPGFFGPADAEPSTINFPDADPDTVPSIPATENPVQVTANVTTGNNKTVTLTALAQGDLVSGSNTIPISNVTWTASGNGFSAGTMSKSAAQQVGRWTGTGHPYRNPVFFPEE